MDTLEHDEHAPAEPLGLGQLALAEQQRTERAGIHRHVDVVAAQRALADREAAARGDCALCEPAARLLRARAARAARV